MAGRNAEIIGSVFTAVAALVLSGCQSADRVTLKHIEQQLEASARVGARGPTDTRDSTVNLAGAFDFSLTGASRSPVSSITRLSTDDWPTLRLVRDRAESFSDSQHDRPARPGPLPGFWETLKRDLKAMPSDVWEDTKTVYKSPTNLLILGSAYGASLTLQATHVDDTVEDSLRNKDIFGDDFNIALSVAGNPATHFGVAGLWYLIGQQNQDDKTYEVGKTLFSALIINGLSTTFGKMATFDKAPNGERFAFPSGHTSSTFTVASVLHEAYGPWVGVPLYGLGVLVAVERLDDGEHYLSDVIMGGVMGLVIGHSVASGHEFELFGGHVVPYADPSTGATGIAWRKRF
jgi:membrane-associated phospholipid phosphatase